MFSVRKTPEFSADYGIVAVTGISYAYSFEFESFVLCWIYKMSITMERREHWVDYAKAIGIILVVFGHVSRGLHNAGIEIPTEFYELADSIVYSFHMPLFFFLSGLFFYNSFINRGIKNLVLNKIDTIFYPYVIWSIIQGTIEVILSTYTNGEVSITQVLEFLWAPRAQFWFLYVLLFTFIFFSFVYSSLSKISAVIVLSAISIFFYFSAPHIGNIGVVKQFMGSMVFFALGVLFTIHIKVNYVSTPKFLICSGIVFILSQWYFHSILSLRYVDKGVETLFLAIVSIFFVVSVSTYLSLKNAKLLAYIGSSSMVIYLMHILAGSGIRVILGKVFNVDSYYIHITLGCIVGVSAPLCALWLIKKLNIRFLFSAPLSSCLTQGFKKLVART
ncbi:acyltransferase [Vibrio sp. JC009]|uniref:acyltransferase family protein n=1 Tax=Vibrio sp. JC009 TaxID=2912314 RepID=UPI0023B087BC|nr:acyltransferase [Vibrio sp. JC009]WED20624.1 acyltransferase [Vibrio sp. JC009]